MFFQKIRIETANFTVIISITEEAESPMKKRAEIKRYLELAPDSIDSYKLAMWIVDMFGDEVMGIEIWKSDIGAICLAPHLEKYDKNPQINMSISEN